jgi:2-isopropylmalate synthase
VPRRRQVVGDSYTLDKLENQPYFDRERIWASPLNYESGLGQPLTRDVYIHEVTLRDGEQAAGVCFSLADRIRIGEALADLGVKRIEAGMPVVSELVAESITRLVKMKLGPEIVAFCRANSDDIEASMRCGVGAVVIEHTVNPYLCNYAYGLDEPRLLKRLIEAVSRAKCEGLHTTFMGWDFFRSPLEFTKRVYSEVVSNANPDAIVLVDTFGVATPITVYQVVKEFREMFPSQKLEFHCHNEFGWSTGAAITAIAAGADGVHSAINGLGERTGNLPTEEIATALNVLFGVGSGVQLDRLAEVCRLVSDISGVPIPRNKAVMGPAVFQSESGIVTDVYTKMGKYGVKPAMTPYLPEIVGAPPVEFVLGKGSGSASIRFFLDKHGLEATDDEVDRILTLVKTRSYEKKGLLTDAEFLDVVSEVKS